MSCFNLFKIKILDEELYARPIEWDDEIVDIEGHNALGEQVNAIKYECTCPNCSNLIEFTINDIYKDYNNNDNIKCPLCNSGNEPASIISKKKFDSLIKTDTEYGNMVNKELLSEFEGLSDE